MGYELVTELLPFFAQSCHITKCRKVHKLLLFKCFCSCLPFLLSLSLFYELSLKNMSLCHSVSAYNMSLKNMSLCHSVCVMYILSVFMSFCLYDVYSVCLYVFMLFCLQLKYVIEEYVFMSFCLCEVYSFCLSIAC